MDLVGVLSNKRIVNLVIEYVGFLESVKSFSLVNKSCFIEVLNHYLVSRPDVIAAKLLS